MTLQVCQYQNNHYDLYTDLSVITWRLQENILVHDQTLLDPDMTPYRNAIETVLLLIIRRPRTHGIVEAL